MRKEKVPRVSHVSDNVVESWSIGLGKTKNVVPCAFIRVKNLKLFIEEIFNRENLGFITIITLVTNGGFYLGGDKGGGGGAYEISPRNRKFEQSRFYGQCSYILYV